MPIDLIGLNPKPYIGLPQGLPMDLCKAPKEGPKYVPLIFNWDVYTTFGAADKAVSVNLKGGNAPGQQLSQIQGMYIDNTNVPFSVFVVFPDSNYTIAVEPYSTIFMPVITDGLNFVVLTQGILPYVLPTSYKTRVYAINVAVNPFLDPQIQNVFPQYKGSPAIQRGNLITPGFAPPALGDQVKQTAVNFGTETTFLSAASGFLYITSIVITICNVVVTTSAFIDCILADATLGDATIYDVPYTQGSADGTPSKSLTLLSVSGLNLRLDGTHQYNFRVPIASGSVSGLATIALHYTYNPT